MPSYTTGLMTGYGASVSLRAIEASADDGTILLEIFAYSGRLRTIDVRMQYRVLDMGDWMDDAFIAATGSMFIDGNLIMGVPCSPGGERTVVEWNFAGNGLAFGQACQVRLDIVPDPLVFSTCLNTGWVETVMAERCKSIGDKIRGMISGRDSKGNYLVLRDDSFAVIDSDLKNVFSVSGFQYPQHAQETPGGYIVLDTYNNRIVELNDVGVGVRTFDASAIALRPSYFAYDPLAENLLLSGGDIHRVYEMTWSDLDYGTVLWQHGTVGPGGGATGFTNPDGVAWKEGDRDVIYVADRGNGRIVIVDRNPPAETVTWVTEVSFDDGACVVPFSSPSRVMSSGGVILVGEQDGEDERFSEIKALHPSLTRSLASMSATVDRKDKMPQYRNLLFAPVLRGE